MNKFKLLLMPILMICATANAQIQQGYVKTLGRATQKGMPLSGVFVRVKGEHNPVLSREDGTLALLLTGKKNGDAYTLQEVQKKGYELNETGVIGRQYAYSDKVPLTIVMVSSLELQADKQRIENNAFKVAEKNYKAKLELLEKQKEENAISEEQYRKVLLDLQDKFEKYQLLIDGLAEHYAHVDYDDLNEKEREISICIENGELERADSLIKTMFDPIDVLKRNQKALSRLEQQLSQANDIITQSNENMAAVLKQQEKDANYLYQLYTIALSRFDNDKAGQYIATRAELDTTNILWQTQAGEFYLDYLGDYSTSINYFSRALDISVSLYGKLHQQVALCYAYIGRAIEMSGNYEQAERAYNEALVIQKRVLPEFHWDIARSYRLLSEIYLRQRELSEAANYNQHAAIILMGLLKYSSFVEGSQDPAGNVLKDSIDFEKVKKELSNSYITTGKIYEKNNMLEEAKRYYNEALKIRLKNKYCHMADSIECYLNLGSVLYHIGDIIRARTILQNGLQTSKKLWGENHIFTLSFYDYLGLVYSKQNDIEDASMCHRIALDAKRMLYGNMNIEFVKSLCYYGFSYDNVRDSIKAAAYRELALGVTNSWLETGRNCSNDNYESLQESLNYYYDALDIRQLLLGDSHPEIAMVYNLMGVSYRKLSRTYMAISVYKKALEIVQSTYKEPHPSVAAIRNNLAQVYYEISDYRKALENLLESLRIKELLYEPNNQKLLSAIEMADIVFEKCIEYYPTDKSYKKQYELFKKKYNLVK